MRIRISMALIALLAVGPGRAEGGDYHWPMAARPALTSTFGEYRQGRFYARSGRFHAGIDLKTWGREGYPVLAVDDGYVWRVRTSPWGYGKAVYIKLRDGRTAVYAHLSAFAPSLVPIVEAEQERRGRYSVNLFLKQDQILVRRGEKVGFSGSTGTGVPHLHFELRDKDQRPINALKHGFDVQDTTAPTIRSLALLPLDADARVAGGHAPYTFGVRWHLKKQRYGASRQVVVEGRFGVAVEVYDRADASVLTNRLAPYRLRLLVDGREVFQTAYTAFGYDEVHQVELDRNFALRRLGVGKFHNLFRAEGNRLALYGDYQPGDGVLYAGTRPAERGVALGMGPHRLRVVAEDAAGNRSEAEVAVLVDARPRILAFHAEAAGDSVRLRARYTDEEPVEVAFEESMDGGETWRISGAARAKTEGVFAFTHKRRVEAGALYRVRVRDPYGLEAFQTGAPVKAVVGAGMGSMLKCGLAFYPDFAVIRIDSDRLLAALPRVTVRWPGRQEAVLEVTQRALRAYEALVRFDPEAVGRLTVSAVDLRGEAGHQTLTLDQQKVGLSGGRVHSEDGAAEARFDSGEVYRTLFARVFAGAARGPEGLPTVGLAYRFTPVDVPFNGRADLVLRYPAGFDRPERLGVYEQADDSTWAFVGNRLDSERGTVAAEVAHFSTYGLLLDALPPEVTDLRPATGAKTEDRRPLLVATVRDVGSGIGREKDISVRLDGKEMIFEYDPEAKQVTARPKRPLRPGAHHLEVTVRDMCGNKTRETSRFTVW